MAKIKIKQHDITDCGAACLASISSHFNLQIHIARILQYAGTDDCKGIILPQVPRDCIAWSIKKNKLQG